jgi:hypothetical protein
MVFKFDWEAAGLKRPKVTVWLNGLEDLDEDTDTNESLSVAAPLLEEDDRLASGVPAPLKTNSPQTLVPIPRATTRNAPSCADAVVCRSAATASKPLLSPVRRRIVPTKTGVALNRVVASSQRHPSSVALVLYTGRRRRTQAELLNEDWKSLPYFRHQQRTPLLLEYGSRYNNNQVRRSRRIANRLLLTQK